MLNSSPLAPLFILISLSPWSSITRASIFKEITPDLFAPVWFLPVFCWPTTKAVSSILVARSSLLLSCPCLWRTGICHVCDCNPAHLCVLCSGILESSWITVWTRAATAASTVAVVTASAAATTSPWAASIPGRTTTKEAGSSVRLWCRATGGSLACWAGSEADVWDLNPSWCCGEKFSFLMNIPERVWAPSCLIHTCFSLFFYQMNETEAWLISS